MEKNKKQTYDELNKELGFNATPSTYTKQKKKAPATSAKKDPYDIKGTGPNNYVTMDDIKKAGVKAKDWMEIQAIKKKNAGYLRKNR